MADWGNIAQGVSAGLGSGVDTFVKLKQLGLMEEEMARKKEQIEIQKDMQNADLHLKIMSDHNMPDEMKKNSYNAFRGVLIKRGLSKEEQMPPMEKWESNFNKFAKQAHGLFQSFKKGETDLPTTLDALHGLSSQAQTPQEQKNIAELAKALENQQYAQKIKEANPDNATGIADVVTAGGLEAGEKFKKITQPDEEKHKNTIEIIQDPQTGKFRKMLINNKGEVIKDLGNPTEKDLKAGTSSANTYENKMAGYQAKVDAFKKIVGRNPSEEEMKLMLINDPYGITAPTGTPTQQTQAKAPQQTAPVQNPELAPLVNIFKTYSGKMPDKQLYDMLRSKGITDDQIKTGYRMFKGVK